MGAYMGTYLSGLVIAAYGILVRRRWFRVVEREVRVPGLDAKLDGVGDPAYLFFVQDGSVNGGYSGMLTDPLMLEPSTP